MLIIAHRGASGEYPENTLLAFEQAIEQGADGVELDVQHHPSGELLLIHDRYVNTNHGEVKHYSELSSEQIKKLSLPEKQSVVTLKQALTCIAGRCLVNIELKCMSDNEVEITSLLEHIRKVIGQAVNNSGFSNQQFIISSFNHSLLKHCEEIIPEVSKAALIACNPLNVKSLTDELSLVAINPSIDCLNHSFVKRVHQLDMQVWVYTVDHTLDIEKCRELGVDAIFTNYPRKTRNYLSAI
ncbi:glycerophosphodiester phosphodiesterase [Thalassotalea atypica]|uniref:glycerophosphodiester phosphodiesterase n=1 Tax=Thalassotalea atypica TaxID=2054316 RepID=UPI0025747834|nr:glycerophosphodiester phosphodiesterase family protein [Thalassotalea atypica]